MMRRDLIAFALESAISVQLVLFTAFLLSGGRRTPAHYLLAGLSGVLAAMTAANLAAAMVRIDWLTDPVLFLDLLAPALFYLYVRQMHDPAPRLRPRDALHALPAVVGLAIWETGLLPAMDFYVIACWTAYVGAAAYFFRRDHRGFAPRTLRRFILALMVILGATVVLRVAIALQPRPEMFRDGVAYLLVLAALCIATCQLLFTSLRYPNLLTSPGSYVKYGGSNADAAGMDALERNFAGLLRDARPYLNPDITLDELAVILSAPARQVSQLVNARYGMNVPSYMNQCRAREAARLLEQALDKPIKVVMFESGFKSKSAFNREFQRFLGTSPSEFRRQKSAAPSRDPSRQIPDGK